MVDLKIDPQKGRKNIFSICFKISKLDVNRRDEFFLLPFKRFYVEVMVTSILVKVEKWVIFGHFFGDGSPPKNVGLQSEIY